MGTLEQQLSEVIAVQQQLLEKTNSTSRNSSSPPSQDPVGFGKKPGKKKSSKKRGGQPGHDGHSRELYPPEGCTEVIEHYPAICSSCGESLNGEDENPYRHQIVEIPPIKPIIIERGTVTDYLLANRLCPDYLLEDV